VEWPAGKILAARRYRNYTGYNNIAPPRVQSASRLLLERFLVPVTQEPEESRRAERENNQITPFPVALSRLRRTEMCHTRLLAHNFTSDCDIHQRTAANMNIKTAGLQLLIRLHPIIRSGQKQHTPQQARVLDKGGRTPA
jgi:hypothetical protein